MKRPKRLTAKYPGECPACNRPVEPGDAVYWFGRGRGVQHVDCEHSRLRAEWCTTCKGHGALWNNAPCRSCDGTGSRKVQDFAKQPDIHPVDQT